MTPLKTRKQSKRTFSSWFQGPGTSFSPYGGKREFDPGSFGREIGRSPLHAPTVPFPTAPAAGRLLRNLLRLHPILRLGLLAWEVGEAWQWMKPGLDLPGWTRVDNGCGASDSFFNPGTDATCNTYLSLPGNNSPLSCADFISQAPSGFPQQDLTGHNAATSYFCIGTNPIFTFRVNYKPAGRWTRDVAGVGANRPVSRFPVPIIEEVPLPYRYRQVDPMAVPPLAPAPLAPTPVPFRVIPDLPANDPGSVPGERREVGPSARFPLPAPAWIAPPVVETDPDPFVERPGAPLPERAPFIPPPTFPQDARRPRDLPRVPLVPVPTILPPGAPGEPVGDDGLPEWWRIPDYYPDAWAGPKTVGDQDSGVKVEVKEVEEQKFELPARGERDKKVLVVAFPPGTLKKIVGGITEGMDLVSCLHAGLPALYQAQAKYHPKAERRLGGHGRKVEPSLQRKFDAVWRNLDRINVGNAIYECAKEQAKDIFYGRLGRTSAKLSRRAGFSHGFQLGPAL